MSHVRRWKIDIGIVSSSWHRSPEIFVISELIRTLGFLPGGLPSMRSHRVGHDWSDLAAGSSSILIFGLFIRIEDAPSLLGDRSVFCSNEATLGRLMESSWMRPVTRKTKPWLEVGNFSFYSLLSWEGRRAKNRVNDQPYRPDEASVKIPKTQGSKSFWVGEHVEMLGRMACLNRAWNLPPLPYILPLISAYLSSMCSSVSFYHILS